MIRDWYSGGRVDGVYPLPCYRAAIKALPSDVLQYSDADRVIASALAYARQGKRDAARAAAKARARAQEPAQDEATTTRSVEPTERQETAPRPKAKPKRAAPAPAPAPTPVRPEPDAPRQLASGPQPATDETSVPYPVIALAALSGVLLVSAATGWLARRRR